MKGNFREGQRWKLVKVHGCDVIFAPFSRAGVASIQIWIRAGASLEKEHERGVAHFLEHMLFQTRSKGGRTLAEEVESLGGSINAWTSQDFTVVHATFPADAFETIGKAMLLYVLEPDLQVEALERERGVILQEIAREEENPAVTCTKTLFELRYEGHPYGRRVLGTKESVAALKLEDLMAFHSRYYRPSNIAISVVGRLETDRVFAFFDKVLSKYSDRGPDKFVRPQKAKVSRAQVRRIERDTAEVHFAFGFPIPDLFHRDVPALDCFSAYLGELKGSLLEAWRRKEGLVNDIGTFSYTPQLGGTFLVQGTTSPSKVREAIKSLWEVIGKALESPPPESTMAAIRQEVIATAMRISETAQGLSGRLGHEVAIGRPGFSKEYEASILSLTAEEVYSVARRYLRRPCSAVLLGPKEAIVQVEAPRKFQVLSPPPFVPRPSQQRLEGGGILLHYREWGHGTVAIRITVPGGLEWETKKQNGLHALLGRLHLSGAKGRPGPDILREFDALGAQVGLHAGFSYVSAWLDVPAGQAMAASRLLCDCLTEPNLEAQDIGREAQLLVETITSRSDRPQALLLRELLRRLFEGDPYGLDPLGDPEVLKTIGRDLLEEARTRLWQAEKMRLAVVGDIDPEPIASLFSASFGHEKGLEPLPLEPLEPKNLGTIGEIEGPFRQSHIGLAWPGPPITAKDLIAARVAVTTLSMMSGPLFRVLRDNLGIAYALGAELTALRRGGYVVISAAVRPGTEDQALKAIRDVVNGLLDGRMTSLLEDGAIHLAGSEEISLQKKSRVAHWMCAYFDTPLGYDSFLDIGRRIRSVRPEEALSAAQKVFSVEPVVVVLRPRG